MGGEDDARTRSAQGPAFGQDEDLVAEVEALAVCSSRTR
jgi:hypothetical protein